MKTLPTPISLSTPMVPPIMRTKRRQIASPSPIPPGAWLLKNSSGGAWWPEDPISSIGNAYEHAVPNRRADTDTDPPQGYGESHSSEIQ